MTYIPFDLVIDVRKAFDTGIGTYIRQVVPRVIDRLGVPATVWVPQGERDRHAYLSACNVRVVEVHAPPLGFAEQLALRRLLDERSLLWATSLAHPLLRHGPLVATVHDVVQLALGGSQGVPRRVSLAAHVLLSSLRRRASALMAVSSFTRSEFLQRVGSPTCGDIAVTPLGVDAAWFDAAATRAEPSAVPRFVSVGSVRPHKNLARLLQAFALVADRLPHELVFAGLAARHGEHLQWLETLPSFVRPRVHFAGHMEDAELRALVARADALVFPSLYEGFGLPALEAMAAGCPVLASSAASLPEVCGSAAAAYFEPGSVEQIAQALLRHAALTQAERQTLVERGVAHARTFTWERTADLTAAVIDTALRQGGGTR